MSLKTKIYDNIMQLHFEFKNDEKYKKYKILDCIINKNYLKINYFNKILA